MKHNKELEELINQMHLEEKISMLHGDGFFQTKGIKRLHIPPLKMSDGPMGVRQEFPNSSWLAIGNSNDYVSYFPSGTALAATWNPELAYEFGQSIGCEARSRGKDVILGPGVNIIRSPLCGRNFEYMSEDPCLTSLMAVPIINGIQENDVAACVKHFIANNQETNRLEVNVELDQRALEEIYLPAFEASIVKARAYTIMAAYNKLRGDYCCESEYLLNDILRERYGFKGLVISDWGACHSTKGSAQAGLDIEMAVASDFNNYYFANNLYQEVLSGNIDESIIDQKVYHVLHIMKELNMLNPNERLDSQHTKRKKGSRNTLNHQKAALETANESIILLENKDKTLPLDPSSIKRIAIIGENANKAHAPGGGSAEIKALYEHSPYAGIDMLLGGNHEITYVKGYTSDPKANSDTLFNLRQEAIRIASTHDTLIFVGGLNHDHDTEGSDRSDYHLPYEQDRLIEELSQANPNLIVAILSGSSLDLSKAKEFSKALLYMSYNGMEGGKAFANVLFGRTNPSGKLTYTIAKELEDYSSHSIGEFPGQESVGYLESIYVGYRHFDSRDISPLYPFGYGLSYTSFDYNNLNIVKTKSNIKVTLNVKNTGLLEGREVIQLYIHDCDPREPRPYKELKAFKKINLKPLQSQEITFILNNSDFAYFSQQKNEWVCENGKYEVLIGSSSKDIRLLDSLILEI